MTDGTALDRKYRQAAFTYLHVGVLYEAAAWVMMRNDLLPTGRGPVWLWLVFGAVIVALVFWGLWSWRNRWFARAIWAIHSLRLPALIDGAFFRGDEGAIPPGFYVTAIVVVVINLVMLARAGWDL